MIINEDSPLRRLPAEMDGRQALFFDAIRFAIEMADFSHTRLLGTLQSLATTLGTDSPMHAETPAALADAWSIVDSVHRLRCLIEQVPGLSKRQRWPAIAVFDRETAAIEDLRNTVQHLTSEIPAIAEANWPVWGILHWVVLDEGRASARICTLVAGRIAPRSHPLLEPGGRTMYECDLPIGRITLHPVVAKKDLVERGHGLRQQAPPLAWSF